MVGPAVRSAVAVVPGVAPVSAARLVGRAPQLVQREPEQAVRHDVVVGIQSVTHVEQAEAVRAAVGVGVEWCAVVLCGHLAVDVVQGEGDPGVLPAGHRLAECRHQATGAALGTELVAVAFPADRPAVAGHDELRFPVVVHAQALVARSATSRSRSAVWPGSSRRSRAAVGRSSAPATTTPTPVSTIASKASSSVRSSPT
jgi:hypothetical protein